MKPTPWNSIPRVFFSFRPDGESLTSSFEPNWTTFVNPAFCPAWKSPLKMVVWNRPRGIRSQGCFFVSPRWRKSKKRVWSAIGRRSSTRLFALLGKAHSKWWYETDPMEFDSKGFFSFRPDGESPTSSFEPNWTTFVNPAFCPAWKSPLKMVVWNRHRGIRSQGCFFVSPRWGKSKKRVLSTIGRRSSTRLFALLGKAHSKWWYETDPMEFDPKGFFSFRPDWESPTSSFEPNWTTFVNPAFCPAWKSPLKVVVWNGPRGIRSQGCFFVSPRWGKSNKFAWTQLDDVRQPGFLPCLEKPTQNGGMKPTSWNSILRVFFHFAPMGKVQQIRLNPIGRRSSTRLFTLLGKDHSKWWYETDLVEFDLKGVFSFRPDGESQTNSFEPNWTTFVNPAFCPAWKSPLKMVVCNRPRGIRFKGVFSFRPDGESPTNSFEPNWTTFVNPAFCPASKRPLKIVVCNRPRGIRS